MKSKLLQNSKDFLSRNFNPTKCKTSLRLAGSRLKLLRNKKEVQVKQMKREIAQLLESGQDQTARIRVEHVIREEKMMASYDLLEIYCELIIARLPIIESQKECPIDLKEAIASVVFASPRCGDVPELLDVRKHFSAKYGKEFTSAATELRPQCGVGRLLVEKLSAVAPDGQTKIKILNAIAEEHNIKWDPKSCEEKDLSGSSSIKKESKLLAEHPRFEAAEVQSPPSNDVHGSPLNFAHQETRISLGAEKLYPGQTSGVSTKIQPEARHPGDEVSQLFQGESHNSHLDRQEWNMEFKDASTAAQVAAESAERASIAARAAAELSSHGRILTPYSTESHKSDVYSSKDGLEAPPNLNTFERNSEASVDISSCKHTGLQNAQIDITKPSNLMTSSRFEEGIGGSEEYSQSASLKSRASGDDDSTLYHSVPFVDEYTQKNALNEISEGETNMKKQSFSYETEVKPSNLMTSLRFEEGIGGSEEYSQSASLKSKASGDDDSTLYHSVPFVDEYTQKNALNEVSEGETNMKKQSLSYETEVANGWPEKAENLGEGKFVKQKSLGSSCSQSSIPDDVNIFATFDDQKFENDASEDHKFEKKFENDAGKDPFMSVGETGFREAPQTISHESAAVLFDKSDSDGDDYDLDKGPKYGEQDLDFQLPSLGQKLPEPLSINTESWSPRLSSSNMVTSASPPLFFTGEKSSSHFSRNTILRDDSELDDSAPVRFDDSDRPTSDSDEDVSASKVEDCGNFQREHNERGQEEYLDIGNVQLSLSSDDEGIHWKRNQDNNSDAGSSEIFSHLKPSAEPPEDSQIDLKDNGNELSTESGERLNFGKLTGGFRHKGHNQLPFFKNILDSPSSVKKEVETSTSITSYSSLDDPKISATLDHKKSAHAPDLHSKSDSDSSEEEEFLRKKSSHRKSIKTKSTLGTSNSIFGPNDGDLDEDYPKEPLTSHKQSLSAIKPVKTKSTLGASYSIFGSDDSDLDEDYPKESLNRKSHLRSGISRRTKASPSSRANTRSEALHSDGTKRKPTTSYNTASAEKTGAHKRNSGKWEIDDQPISEGVASMPTESSFSGTTEATPVIKHKSEECIPSRLGNSAQPNVEQGASKPTSSTSLGIAEKPNSGKTSYKTMQESKVSQKSSAIEEPPRLQKKTDATTGSEISRTSSNKDDGSKKASHVHPKLPDYDALVQSLRMNRS